jgi:hypothetical protein
MVGRYDVVLAVIPALAISGVLLGRGLELLASTTGVGTRLVDVPFAVLGLIAALVVIVRELFVVGHPAE